MYLIDPAIVILDPVNEEVILFSAVPYCWLLIIIRNILSRSMDLILDLLNESVPVERIPEEPGSVIALIYHDITCGIQVLCIRVSHIMDRIHVPVDDIVFILVPDSLCDTQIQKSCSIACEEHHVSDTVLIPVMFNGYIHSLTEFHVLFTGRNQLSRFRYSIDRGQNIVMNVTDKVGIRKKLIWRELRFTGLPEIAFVCSVKQSHTAMFLAVVLLAVFIITLQLTEELPLKILFSQHFLIHWTPPRYRA